MLKRTITIIILISFIAYLIGCYSTQEIKQEQLSGFEDYEIISIVMIGGELYVFEKTTSYPKPQIKDSLIVAWVKESIGANTYKMKETQIPLSKVKTIYIEQYDAGKSWLAGIGITLGVMAIAAGIVAATKESCPFIYSFDGEKYIFDGEPYGGAICPALERTDYCLLENLKPFKDKYLIHLTNEVDETQYTNEFKLWAADHPQNASLIPDITGNLFTVSNPLKLFAATENGNDILKWIEEKDLLLWESDMTALTADVNLRDTICLSFPKPKDTDTVKLIVNGGTTLWGSQMLKRMTEIRGEQIDQWFKSLENPFVKSQLDYWNDREELYQLQVKVNSGNQWINKGEIWGGGPFITEDRVVLLDVSDIKSDTLKIMIAPPKGFWSFNWFAVDYSAEIPYEFKEISATKIVSDDGIDLKDILQNSDTSYYEMPETGQRAYLEFPVPELKPEFDRSVFAKVSGYYDIHMNKTGEPQNELIRRIAFEPGFPVKYSFQEFSKWITEIKKGTASN